MDTVHLLETYGEHMDHIACKLAARWIRSETEHSKERGIAALADPLVQALYKEAQRPPAAARPGSIMGYFTGGAAPRTAAAAPAPAPAAPRTAAAPAAPAPAAPRTAAPAAPEEQVALFSDGACSNNGKKHAKAGFGVTVGLIGAGYREMAEVAEPLHPSESQTNQRAELRGLNKAWNIATTQLPAVLKRMGKSSTTTVHIYTDSQYSLDCLLKWAPAWSKKGWKKANGDDVLHQDIIEPLFAAIAAWKKSSPPYTIEFHHVRSHTGKTDPISTGNARADELATSTIS
jgi:ribonuclease HI